MNIHKRMSEISEAYQKFYGKRLKWIRYGNLSYLHRLKNPSSIYYAIEDGTSVWVLEEVDC